MEGPQRRCTASYTLEPLSVVRYSGRLRLNEQQRVAEIRDSVPHTYALRDEASATVKEGIRRIQIQCHQPQEPTITTKERTIKRSGTPEHNMEVLVPLKANTPHNREQPRTSHEPLSCSVCTEVFFESDDVRILPCDHVYHQSCIDPWLLDFASTCPLW